ncbi:MAG: hypothetical protein AAFY88_06855 [Acidobacteriota bacterium]
MHHPTTSRTATRSVIRSNASLSALAILLLMTPIAVDAQGFDIKLERESLAKPMDWLYSALFVPHRDEVVVTNPKTDSIFAIGRNGERLWQETSPGLPSSLSTAPPIAAAAGKRYLEVLELGRVQWIDEQFRPDGAPENLALTKSSNALVPRTFFNSSVTDSGWIIGYGSVQYADSSVPLYGFIAQSVKALGAREDAVHLVHPLTASELFYRLSDSYVAAVGSDFFFVALERTPRLYRVALNTGQGQLRAERLPGLPYERALITPSFRESNYGYEPLALYKALESFSGIPVGLESQAGKLFVLYRPTAGATADEESAWELVALQPKTDRVEVAGRFCITSDAEHLTMVPGPEHWILFERGTVYQPDPGNPRVSQDISSFLRLDTQELQATYSRDEIPTSCGLAGASSPAPGSRLAEQQ